jgi:plasmid stabilization system protein ParE
MSRYAFHPEAFADLVDIWEFIAEDNIDAADRVIGEIFDVVRSLPAFSHQGRRRPELTGRPLRFVVVRDYLIAYAPEARPLWVVGRLAWPPKPACHGCGSQGQGVAWRRTTKGNKPWLRLPFTARRQNLFL